jgi:hypothetical protein
MTRSVSRWIMGAALVGIIIVIALFTFVRAG